MLYEAITHQYPDAIFFPFDSYDVHIADDGQGEYITSWRRQERVPSDSDISTWYAAYLDAKTTREQRLSTSRATIAQLRIKPSLTETELYNLLLAVLDVLDNSGVS